MEKNYIMSFHVVTNINVRVFYEIDYFSKLNILENNLSSIGKHYIQMEPCSSMS